MPASVVFAPDCRGRTLPSSPARCCAMSRTTTSWATPASVAGSAVVAAKSGNCARPAGKGL